MSDSHLFYQYQLGRPLGNGWLGAVYSATDLDESREVALRILDDANVSQSFLLMQLERLLFKVNTLQHAHLLPTGLLQQREGRAFYAMNLGVQGSVRRLLQRQARAAQPLPLVTCVELARQAALGLTYAHSQGLMHGNLKPENLILQNGRALLGNEGYTVQLSDFGLAELRAGSYGTHDRAVVNAWSYLSPEQGRGIRNELRTDLYALGVILYELITGMTPFEIHDAADALEKHQHVAPKQPSTLRHDLPDELEEIILTCMAKRPDDRYASAEALEAALQDVLNRMMPSGPEPTVRLPTLPVMPTPPNYSYSNGTQKPKLLVFDERHQLLREYPLELPSFTVGRASRNDIILEHAGVSRHHLNVDFSAGEAFVTELTATNGTLLDGLPLTPLTRLRWPYQTPLYLRPYWLVLVGPDAPPVRPRIVVKPEQERVKLMPGIPSELSVMVANTGQIVDHLRVSLDGIPPEWVLDAHQSIQLNPGTQGSLTLTLLAPKASTSVAGEYAVTALARSLDDPEHYGRAPLTIEVLPFQEVIAKLLPPIRRTWRRTKYTFRLENRSNTPLHCAPTFRDNEGNLHLLANLRDMAGQINVGPGTAGLTTIPTRAVDPNRMAQDLGRQVTMQARASAMSAFFSFIRGDGRIKIDDLPRRMLLTPGQVQEEIIKAQVPFRWVGTGSQHQLEVDVFPVDQDGEALPHQIATASASLHHNPIIPLWLLPILLLLVGILIWWLTRPPAIDEFALSGSQTTVAPGKPFELRWETSRAKRVELLELGPAGKNLKVDGHLKIPKGITTEQKYTLIAYSLIGRRISRDLMVQTTTITPVIETFEVKPEQAQPGKPVIVTWKVRDAEKVYITGIGDVPLSGSRQFMPSKDMALRLTARAGTAKVEETRDISLLGAQIISFKAEKEEITKGESTVLRWEVENAVSVDLSPGGKVATKGEKSVNPKTATQYTLRATGGNGQGPSETVMIQVVEPKPEVTALNVSPNPVRSDGKITIRWSTKNATAVTVQDGTGTQEGPPNGQIMVPAPSDNATISVTARNNAGETAERQASLSVNKFDPTAAAQDQKEANQAKQIKFKAEPEELVGQGDVTLTWEAPGFQSVRILPLTGELLGGAFPPQGSKVVKNVDSTRTYTLYIKLRNGKEIREKRTVKVRPLPAKVITFKASSQELAAPGTVELEWEVEGAQAVRITPLAGAPYPGNSWPVKGKRSVNLSETTTFKLLAGDQEQTITVQVKVPKAQILHFEAQPNSITGPGKAVLSWEVGGVNSVRIDGLQGPNQDGSWPAKMQNVITNLTSTKTFILRAGTEQARTTVTVLPKPKLAPAEAQINFFKADKERIEPGQSVTLSWSAQNVKDVAIEGVLGRLPAIGSKVIKLNNTQTFTLMAGKARQALTVQVAAPPRPGSSGRYAVLIGEWDHPLGKMTIRSVTGRRAVGTFSSLRSDILNVPLDIVFNGDSLNAKSPQVPNFALVAKLAPDMRSFSGTYTLRDQHERWCAYRPGDEPPSDCY